MQKNSLWHITLFLLIFSFWSVKAFSQDLKISLFQTQVYNLPKSILVTGQFKIVNSSNQLFNGQYQVVCANKSLQLKSLIFPSRIIVQKPFFIFQGHSVRLEFGQINRAYPNIIIIKPDNFCKLHFENIVSEKDYINIVTGSEMPNTWPEEALKVQAILSQSLMKQMLIKQRQNKSKIYDSTQQQAYLGLDYVNENIKKSVSAVRGKYLKQKEIYFHADCGGQNTSSVYFSGKPEANNFKSIKCHGSALSPFNKPHIFQLSKLKFKKLFGCSELKIIKKDSGGRPLVVELCGKKQLSAYKFWLQIGQIFGWDKIPSTLFKLKSNEKYFIFSSIGAGHGIGVCQWGVYDLASKGKNYQTILQIYYGENIFK